MAQLTAGIGTSHVPLIGVGSDQNKMDNAYFKPIFDGFKWTKDWIKKPENKPDVVILVFNDERLQAIPHIEYLRETGSEGIEMVMWLVMRGALSGSVEELHRHYHVPASNTALGHIVLRNGL